MSHYQNKMEALAGKAKRFTEATKVQEIKIKPASRFFIHEDGDGSSTICFEFHLLEGTILDESGDSQGFFRMEIREDKPWIILVTTEDDFWVHEEVTDQFDDVFWIAWQCMNANVPDLTDQWEEWIKENDE
jgi:hypothetical protein